MLLPSRCGIGRRAGDLWGSLFLSRSVDVCAESKWGLAPEAGISLLVGRHQRYPALAAAVLRLGGPGAVFSMARCFLYSRPYVLAAAPKGEPARVAIRMASSATAMVASLLGCVDGEGEVRAILVLSVLLRWRLPGLDLADSIGGGSPSLEMGWRPWYLCVAWDVDVSASEEWASS